MAEGELALEQAAMPCVPADLLQSAFSGNRSRVGLVLPDGNSLTIGELEAEASRYAQLLSAFPLNARIGVLSRNRAEVVHILNAIPFSGLCAVPLHPFGSVEDFAYVTEDASLDALAFDPDHYCDIAAELAARFPDLQLFSFGPAQIGIDIGALAAEVEPQPLSIRDRDPEAIERLAYSGGTTGRPKGIMLSRRALATTYAIQLSEWEWPAEVRALLCAPLSHSGSALLVPTLHRGGAMYVLDGFDPLAVMQAIEARRITCTLLVPTMIYALLDHPRFAEFDLSSLECVYYGASSIIPARLKEAIARIGPVFFQFYGQSEAPMTVTVMRRSEHDVDDELRLASCGRPVPWVRVSLRDDRGREVADGNPGEVCVQGSLLMSGYVNQPEETAKAIFDGWLRTGDIAVCDREGFLRIVDRKKDMIISGGFNVFAREVEDALNEHDGVAGCAVVGVPDAKWGEAVAAVVVRLAGTDVSEADLMAHVRKRKGAVQTPKLIKFVDTIPLSGLGKPDKNQVRDMFADQSCGIAQ
ncbi:AMP-binding protein [Sphingopyxis sp. DBS4]|uniref:AMP-binding protein n=1 Tax=Sphingopyxis sp. DBS4 TaxID=2968500 RepID=UPI00214AF518|nr:AMP-binding protein [Sphingopyxis sp. DBS4]